jgi:hypothetical protein
VYPEHVAGGGVDCANLLGAQHDHLIMTADLRENRRAERIPECVSDPQNATGLLFQGGYCFVFPAADHDESVAV